MQHTIQDSRDVGVADIDYHGNSRQVTQSNTQQGDYEPVLMDEDRPVPEDQDEELDSEKNDEWCEDDNEKDEKEEVSMQWAILQSLYTLRCILVFYHRQWERR